jgi:GntR family transcriptional regulator / MocR family aminotransferase
MARRAPATLLIQLDHSARGRLQQQIVTGVQRAIASGVMRPGTRVPSSRALAADLRVSRTTSQLALDQLRAEGYLVTRHGSGTFVAADLPDDAPEPPDAPVHADHLPLSRRGTALVSGRPAARRIVGPPRPFRLGVPALEQFPVRLWSQLAARRVLAIKSSQLDYGGAIGMPALREAIADHVRASRGARCEPDQIYVVGGAQRGLDFICRLLLDPGDRALMEEPGYPGAWTALTGAGAAIAPVRVDQEGIDVAACARQRGRVRLVYVTPSHQFPLGVPMSRARRTALLEWASAAGVWIVEDDYDSEFRYGAEPSPCLQGLDGGSRVIYVGSFSKSMFPALRLGFLIVPAALRDRMVAARRTGGDPQPPFLEQSVLADFIAGGHFARHLRRMRSLYRERLEALFAAAERYCAGALRLRPLRTGLHAVADLDGADAGRVFDEATARGVEVMPLAHYAFGRARVPDAILLGFGGVGTDAIERGMQGLAAALDAARRTRSGGGMRAGQVAR